jgi:hypothetical protein
MPNEISSRCVVYGRCNAKADRPRLHNHLFNQNGDGALYDLCSNLSESSYIRLQSGLLSICYSLNSQIAFTF